VRAQSWEGRCRKSLRRRLFCLSSGKCDGQCVCVIGVCVNIAICSRTKDAAESVRRARVRVRVRVCLYLLTYLYVTYTFDAVGAVTVVSAVSFISVSNLFFCP